VEKTSLVKVNRTDEAGGRLDYTADTTSGSTRAGMEGRGAGMPEGNTASENKRKRDYPDEVPARYQGEGPKETRGGKKSLGPSLMEGWD